MPVSTSAPKAKAHIGYVPQDVSLDADLRSGRPMQVPVLVSGSLGTSQAAVTDVSSVVARHGAAVQAATFASAHVGHGFAENLAATRSLQRETPVVPVRTEIVNSKSGDVRP